MKFYRKIFITAAIAFLVFSSANSASAKYNFQKNTEYGKAKPSKIEIKTSSSQIKIIVSNSDKITLSQDSRKDGIVFSVTPGTDKEYSAEINKGLVKSISVSKGPISKISILAVSEPECKIQYGPNTIIATIYPNNIKGLPMTRPLIKKSNDYKAGDSILTDIAVIVESSSDVKNKNKPRKHTMFPKQFDVAAKKLSFKENMELLTSNNKQNVERSGEAISSLGKMSNFLPLEKSEKINLKFTNKSLPEIIKKLGEKAKKNVIISPSVSGKKTIEFSDMAPEEAIKTLLKDTEFDFRIMRSIILVGPERLLEDMTASFNNQNLEKENRKKIFVMKKTRGEKVIKELDARYPNVKYVFYPKLNAFEIMSDENTLDEILLFLTKQDK